MMILIGKLALAGALTIYAVLCGAAIIEDQGADWAALEQPPEPPKPPEDEHQDTDVANWGGNVSGLVDYRPARPEPQRRGA